MLKIKYSIIELNWILKHLRQPNKTYEHIFKELSDEFSFDSCRFIVV